MRRATKKDASKGACCPMAVGYAIKEMWEEVQEYIKDSCLVERMKEIDVLESYSEPIIAKRKESIGGKQHQRPETAKDGAVWRTLMRAKQVRYNIIEYWAF